MVGSAKPVFINNRFENAKEMKLMRMTKLLFVSILTLLLVGFHGAPLQAQDAMQSPGMDKKSMMKSHMEKMRAQMDQMQTLMKDNMAKMAAADAAMKSHMETEQANMKSQMELQPTRDSVSLSRRPRVQGGARRPVAD